MSDADDKQMIAFIAENHDMRFIAMDADRKDEFRVFADILRMLS